MHLYFVPEIETQSLVKNAADSSIALIIRDDLNLASPPRQSPKLLTALLPMENLAKPNLHGTNGPDSNSGR